jgi:uncharacterized cupredoxin-like copper-binding protein
VNRSAPERNKGAQFREDHIMRLITIAALSLTCLYATAASAQPVDWSHAQVVNVELSNFKFTPSTLTFDHDQPYRLHLTNTSSGGHDFAAKELFAASTVPPEDAAKLKNGAIGLKSGQSADVRLVPMKAGSYGFRCTHFMHSSFGMTGTATVR